MVKLVQKVEVKVITIVLIVVVTELELHTHTTNDRGIEDRNTVFAIYRKIPVQ